MTAPGVGRRLGDRYRLEERLGAGGMGEVWRAIDEVLGRTVAVKLILPALTGEPGFTRRFLSEAQAMAGVQHPGVVTIHDYRGDASGAFLVMQYVQGEPLSRMLDRVGRLSPQATMHVVAQAAAALQSVHDMGIVHRDVKPANLLIRPDGTVMLTDFGIARGPDGTGLTATGAMLGTPSYLAPEQVLGRPATPLSDIYALGLVAYECLAGQRPFVGDNPYAVAFQRVNEAPRTMMIGNMPAAVSAMVDRALAIEPAHRWPTAAAMADAARIATDQPDPIGAGPLATTPPPVPGRVAPPGMTPPPGTPPPGYPVHATTGAPGRTAVHDPFTAGRGTGAGPGTVAPAGRRGRTLIIAAFAVLAILAGVTGWYAFGPPAHGSTPSTGSTSGSTPGGAPGTHPAGGIPAGYVACDRYWCPTAPACWGGLVVISGVASKPSGIDCAAPHYFQTFVAGPLPADDVGVDQKELLNHPDAAAVCSAANLARHSRDASHTSGWDREPLPLQQSDGSWLLICLAGPAEGGEWTGSVT